MTHQQLIDKWHDKIKRHETAQKFLSSTLQIERHRVMEYTAREIYNDLCQMETTELIIKTQSDYNPEACFVSFKCDACGCFPSVIVRTEFGTFCQQHAKYH